MDVSSLPFNSWLGLTTTDNTVQLIPGSDHLNHLGTIHASVLFAVAEAASGNWFVRRFPELTESHVGVLRTSRVKYRRPGSSESPLIGLASCEDATVEEFAQSLNKRGRATLEISAVVKQSDEGLLTATFVWFVSNGRPSHD